MGDYRLNKPADICVLIASTVNMDVASSRQLLHGTSTTPLANNDVTLDVSHEDDDDQSSGYETGHVDRPLKRQTSVLGNGSTSDSSYESSIPRSNDGSLSQAPGVSVTTFKAAGTEAIETQQGHTNEVEVGNAGRAGIVATGVSPADSQSPMQPTVRVIGPVSPRNRLSKAILPQQSEAVNPRPILPNGPAHDSYRGKYLLETASSGSRCC